MLFNNVKKSDHAFPLNMSWCVCFDVAELHPALEAVCQRHRQRLGVCSRSHVCQSHLYRGQQGHCKHVKVFFFTRAAPTVCEVMCSWLSLTLLYFRLRIWLQKLNGHLRTAWSMWAGWTWRQNKQQKKRWEKDVVPGEVSRCCFRETLASEMSWEIQHCHLVWNTSFTAFYFICHRQMQYTTWLAIQSSSWTPQSWTKCSMM